MIVPPDEKNKKLQQINPPLNQLLLLVMKKQLKSTKTQSNYRNYSSIKETEYLGKTYHDGVNKSIMIAMTNEGYLSRHCFPIRPGKDFDINDHFVGPYFATSSTILSSSCK